MSNPLSVHDFKNWLLKQKDMSEFFNVGSLKEDPFEKFIGEEIFPRVSKRKLLQRVEADEDPEPLVEEFIREGGTITDLDEKNALIEVSSGSFQIPRFCIILQKDDVV